jgi:hypothetical protein
VVDYIQKADSRCTPPFHESVVTLAEAVDLASGVVDGVTPVTVAGQRRTYTGFAFNPSMDWKLGPLPQQYSIVNILKENRKL